MTRRNCTISRRQSVDATLSVGTEIAAAGMLWGWFGTAEWSTRRFWEFIGRSHGASIDAKVREACPGCRPGYRYALGEFPPVPLIEPLPADHFCQRKNLVVDGVKHWHVGKPWQRCQADHLRELGEVDGAEWRRFVAWRRGRFPARYVCSADRDPRPKTLVHLCY